jgi:hypothetical protein
MNRYVKVMHQKRFFLRVLPCGNALARMCSLWSKNFFEPQRTQRTQREEKTDVLDQLLPTLTGAVISWKLEVTS